MLGWTKHKLESRLLGSQCTRPKHLVSCIEPGLAIHFLYDIIHVSMPFSQIITHLSLPQTPKDCSIYLCLFCCLAYRVVFTIFLQKTWIKDLGSIPGCGRSHKEENDNPLQYSCLENLTDRGACWEGLGAGGEGDNKG